MKQATRVPAVRGVQIRLIASTIALLACSEENRPTARTDAGSEADADVPMDPGLDCADASIGSGCGPGLHCVEEGPSTEDDPAPLVCKPNYCGDGVRAAGEECDDGNDDPHDGCSPSCIEVPAGCGDGIVANGEECDDANWFNLDECSDACTENRCGNQREDGKEECDDGNSVDPDDCSNACTENRCRNGRLDPGEECDDGNALDDDGTWLYSDLTKVHYDTCSNSCLVFLCGNGRIEGSELSGSEECDDQNDVQDDGCSNQCTKNECGNQRLDPGEVCDGNGVDFLCSDDCSERLQNTACSDCRQEHCTDLQGTGYNVVAECLGRPDQSWVEECSALMECAHQNDCAFGPTPLMPCYCGTLDLNECANTALVPDGPCIDHVEAAARSVSRSIIIAGFGDVSLPLGVAYYLAECERDNCAEECL